ncbi:MAG: fructose-1,6-bisphosphatase, partial [Lachnospiraceae bacterium]|nr:fructose-1,6-bisphosphatase [Lachnospiraceae bacterium]
IVGDIFDRGPGPHVILDTLCSYHSVDIQWGNHDIVWMGAASGHLACIANVVRMAARYGNLDTLEEGYGINLIPLATFALDVYKDADCEAFAIKYNTDYDTKDLSLDMKMHKAIAILQFKLEGQLIKRRPEFGMQDRLLLEHIDYENKALVLDGVSYPMKDVDFPTVNRNRPYELTPEEEQVMERLRQAFVKCEKLQKHVRFLFSKGGLYKVYNSNLLYHGCVPMDEEGNFNKVNVYGEECSGKALYDVLEHYARKGYYAHDLQEKLKGQDIIWYIWAGPNSPVFGKDKMATFERYFVTDKALHVETKNAYYRLLDSEMVVNRILQEFELNEEHSHIVNGHVPVERKKGETPVKCGGKLLVIDGGFSKAYQDKTGIAGYTLVVNSYGMRLVAHEPFESTESAILHESDIFSDSFILETTARRQKIADTDIGAELRESIHQLEELLQAYRDGILIEKIV